MGQAVIGAQAGDQRVLGRYRHDVGEAAREAPHQLVLAELAENSRDPRQLAALEGRHDGPRRDGIGRERKMLVAQGGQGQLSVKRGWMAGGVAANGPLRDTLVAKSPMPVAIPPIGLCTDNGAMIAMSGLINYRNGRRDDWSLDVIPSLRIGTSVQP